MVLVGFSLLGCAARTTTTTLRTNSKSVPSCFSPTDKQTTICKAQTPTEDGRIAITLCIGSQNLQASPELRGKCVEKICAPRSNKDCRIRGRVGVFQQYAELASARLFDGDEGTTKQRSMKAVEPPDPAKAAPAVVTKVRAAAPVVKPLARSLPTKARKKVTVTSTASTKPRKSTVRIAGPVHEGGEPMRLVLRPAKRARGPASIAEENLSKRVCVAKSNTTAPASLRGKCAVRTCVKGKCRYQGPKDMFDRIAAQASGDELHD